MLTMQSDEFLEAIRKNDNQRVSELLRAQPALASTREKGGVSAIFLALYRGNTQAAHEIESRKPDLDIFEASALGNMNRLRSLVESGRSSVDSYSPDGFTALALASYLGQNESTQYLIQHGADPNAVAHNETGFTPLTGAAAQNHNEVAKILVENGANVNYSYEGGYTPLIHAAAAGNIELATLLLERGADPNAKNGEGKTPTIFAKENGHSDMVELLKRYGAN